MKKILSATEPHHADEQVGQLADLITKHINAGGCINRDILRMALELAVERDPNLMVKAEWNYNHWLKS